MHGGEIVVNVMYLWGWLWWFEGRSSQWSLPSKHFLMWSFGCTVWSRLGSIAWLEAALSLELIFDRLRHHLLYVYFLYLMLTAPNVSPQQLMQPPGAFPGCLCPPSWAVTPRASRSNKHFLCINCISYGVYQTNWKVTARVNILHLFIYNT